MSANVAKVAKVARFFLATTSCKSSWDTVPYFGINGLSTILCLWSPLHPLSKLLAIQDHTQNLEEQLWMGGRREVSIISHRPVTRSDLQQERSFFRGSVSTFLQLVVAENINERYRKNRKSNNFCHICCSIFSHGKKNSCYFCDFCEICYFFYTFLIAVFFKYFLGKLRKQFASKFLLTRSILDISVERRGNWTW